MLEETSLIRLNQLFNLIARRAEWIAIYQSWRLHRNKSKIESKIEALAKKWRNRYRDHGELALKDTQQNRSGRPRKTELASE